MPFTFPALRRVPGGYRERPTLCRESDGDVFCDATVRVRDVVLSMIEAGYESAGRAAVIHAHTNECGMEGGEGGSKRRKGGGGGSADHIDSCKTVKNMKI